MNASAPWSTPKLDAAFRKWVRDEHRLCWAKNPALMRRLRKLSDDELLRLEISVLEMAPATPERAYRLRNASDLLAMRSAPRPRIKRRRSVWSPGQSPTPLQSLARDPATPLASPQLSQPATTAAPTAARPEPSAPPRPDNVVRPHFGSKAFGIGGKSFWIGGEV